MLPKISAIRVSLARMLSANCCGGRWLMSSLSLGFLRSRLQLLARVRCGDFPGLVVFFPLCARTRLVPPGDRWPEFLELDGSGPGVVLFAFRPRLFAVPDLPGRPRPVKKQDVRRDAPMCSILLSSPPRSTLHAPTLRRPPAPPSKSEPLRFRFCSTGWCQSRLPVYSVAANLEWPAPASYSCLHFLRDLLFDKVLTVPLSQRRKASSSLTQVKLLSRVMTQIMLTKWQKRCGENRSQRRRLTP